MKEKLISVVLSLYPNAQCTIYVPLPYVCTNTYHTAENIESMGQIQPIYKPTKQLDEACNHILKEESVISETESVAAISKGTEIILNIH